MLSPNPLEPTNSQKSFQKIEKLLASMSVESKQALQIAPKSEDLIQPKEEFEFLTSTAVLKKFCSHCNMELLSHFWDKHILSVTHRKNHAKARMQLERRQKLLGLDARKGMKN